MTQINITIDTPIVDVNEFCSRTGLPLPTVRRMINENLIPVMPRLARTKILINMVAYTMMCANDSQPIKSVSATQKR
jgi:predicted DNA-binding transcriptional regulator AlpA